MKFIAVMKQLLIVLVVCVVIVMAVGIYQGWFTLSSLNGKQGSKTNINLEIDRGKMKEDADALSTKAKKLTDNVTGNDKQVDEKQVDDKQVDDKRTDDK